MTPRQAKRLVGRTIVKVELNEWWAGEGPHQTKAQDPVITLDDGTVLRFTAHEEPDGGDPFVHIFASK